MESTLASTLRVWWWGALMPLAQENNGNQSSRMSVNLTFLQLSFVDQKFDNNVWAYITQNTYNFIDHDVLACFFYFFYFLFAALFISTKLFCFCSVEKFIEIKLSKVFLNLIRGWKQTLLKAS